MSKSVFRFIAAAAVAASLAACGGSTSSSPGGSGSTTSPQTACAHLAHALCALRDSCAPSFGITKSYGTLSACETRTALTCVSALSANGQASTPDRAEACAAAYPGESCTDLQDNNPTAACAPPAGSLQTGAACGASGQCATTFCAVSKNAICGTCQPLPMVGASCEAQADCGRNLACAIPATATAGTCAAWVASGGSCLTGHMPCEAGLACVGDNPQSSTAGTCKPQGTTVGAACDASRKTAANCDGSRGLVCIPTAKGSGVGTCQKMQLVGDGAACGDIGSAPITAHAECQNGGMCVRASAGDKTGTCVTPAAEGAPCNPDVTQGSPCLAPARCVVPSGALGTAGISTLPDASTCT